ncbi:MAG: FCD domain-containing protein [Deltaproteobacteria bacterium]|nr:FCD domain-containing protein [Deltaproteobacteria bacterium]
MEDTTLTQQAYVKLRRDILLGVLPPGSRIRIEALKKQYNIGPTPLREALSRLLSDGFVIAENHRGFSIPPVTLSDLRDITEQRKLIETTALRKAIESSDDHYEATLVATYHRLSLTDNRLKERNPAQIEEWEKRHREFHFVLIEGSHSPWLLKFQSILYDQADRYRRLYLPEVFVPDEVREDHFKIKEATLARDAQRACSLLQAHIERVYQIASTSSLFKEAKV